MGLFRGNRKVVTIKGDAIHAYLVYNTIVIKK
jgi:hypothetical protein